MSRLVNPWPAGRTINKRSPYGWRIHPLTGRRTFHTGVDVAGSFPVTAPADGTVVWVAPEWNDLTPKEKALRTGGNTVVINHVDIHTAYFHGRNQSRLRVGQKIKTGDHIFTSGTTGASTGNHLHFEVRRQQAQSTHMDPVPFLPGGTPVPPTPTKLVEDGILGKATWSAVQQLLTEKGFYKGPITGNPGRNTIRALQKALNEKAL